MSENARPHVGNPLHPNRSLGELCACGHVRSEHDYQDRCLICGCRRFVWVTWGEEDEPTFGTSAT